MGNSNGDGTQSRICTLTQLPDILVIEFMSFNIKLAGRQMDDIELIEY